MTNITFWGLTASPYQLKMQALADFAEVPWRRYPAQASSLQAISLFARMKLARAFNRVERLPGYIQSMDEYPEVPYYSFDRKHFYYDSTGLALHLDAKGLPPLPLVPDQDLPGFLCRLIDEAFDEFGLYMVHHNRWITSASTNIMAPMTVREMQSLLPPFLGKRMRGKLAQRQVRRCPYLFSVAPGDFDCGMPEALTPPSRPGFPSTHELLDSAWRNYLSAMETILSHQPYILGGRFTLADASVYGQLGMNLVDGRAAELLEELAPNTFGWLTKINNGEHRGSRGELFVSDRLNPLLQCITDTFIPLMQQNAIAYEEAKANGQTLFNEAAFDQGEALYNGSLMGMPFRSVAKSFQVLCWQDVCEQWQALSGNTQQELTAQFPVLKASLFSQEGADTQCRRC